MLVAEVCHMVNLKQVPKPILPSLATITLESPVAGLFISDLHKKLRPKGG